MADSCSAVAPAAAHEVAAPAKSTKLPAEAEALLMAFFALQDQLSKEEAAVLAAEACPSICLDAATATLLPFS